MSPSLNHFIITRGFSFVFHSSSPISFCLSLLLDDDAGRCNDVNEAAASAVDPLEWSVVESSSSPSSAGVGTYVADADFDVMPTEVRVAAGTTAYLSCRPRSLRNKTVISYLNPLKFYYIITIPRHL